MSASTTLAPFDASTFAVASPIPLAPPVTTAPLPLSVSMAADPGRDSEDDESSRTGW